jgi:hypothetical protein
MAYQVVELKKVPGQGSFFEPKKVEAKKVPVT